MAEKFFSGDIVAYINVTNPLLKDETIIKAIDTYKKLMESQEYDSLNSAHLIKEFMFQNNQPINYDLKTTKKSGFA